MREMLYLTCFVFAVMLLTNYSGCTLKEEPVSAYANDMTDICLFHQDDDEIPHCNLGYWIINFNIENLSAIVAPDRTSGASQHLDVTHIIPTPTIVVNSYDWETDTVDVDLTIHNPYSIDVYDVRMIIYTDEAGHMLQNADDWTALYDIPGGEVINPFRTYAKSDPKRKFIGHTQETENFKIYLPDGNLNVKFAVDASYPSNCAEPHKIGNLSQEVLYDVEGSSATIQVGVFDHQLNVNRVCLHCPEITGIPLTDFHYIGYSGWELELINSTIAPEGQYQGFLVASSEDSGSLLLYDAVEITITHAGADGWGRTWGGSQFDKGLCTTVDHEGNIYVNGYFMDVVDFDSGEGLKERISNGMEDIFLSKFDRNGKLIWVKSWGGKGRDDIDREVNQVESYMHREIVTDQVGNVYVSGNFRDEVDFDPGPGVDMHKSHGGSDIFVSKFSSSGAFLWAVTWGGIYESEEFNFDTARDIGIDNLGDIYVTGSFTDTADFDPGAGVEFRTAEGGRDVFLSKFNADGQFLWAGTWGGEGSNEIGSGLASDISGNIYVTGDFTGAGDFDPNGGIYTRIPVGFKDAFLSKFDPDGKLIWALNWGGTGNSCFGRDVITDLHGNIFVGGGFNDKGSIDFDPNEETSEERMSMGMLDAYISRFDSNGTFKWVITWGDYNVSRVGHNQCLNLAFDNDEYIYAITSFSSEIDFDPGPDVELLQSKGDQDVALSKFDRDGNLQWARSWGSDASEYGHSVSTDTLGNIYVTGFFGEEENPYPVIDLDPGPGEDLHTSNGSGDAYLIKLLPGGYWE